MNAAFPISTGWSNLRALDARDVDAGALRGRRGCRFFRPQSGARNPASPRGSLRWSRSRLHPRNLCPHRHDPASRQAIAEKGGSSSYSTGTLRACGRRSRISIMRRLRDAGDKKPKKIFACINLIKSDLPKSLRRKVSQHQKRMLPFESKEPRRTHWRTGALNHAIPRGSVWHNVETMGGRRSRYWCGPGLVASSEVVRSTYRRTSSPARLRSTSKPKRPFRLTGISRLGRSKLDLKSEANRKPGGT